MKNLADALALRNKMLGAFELAETEEDPAEHEDLLTFVLVGAGPAGVGMAAAVATLVRTTLKSAFPRIDPRSTRVILIDRASRILGGFSEDLSRKAHERLTKLGVGVRLGHGVERIDAEGGIVAGEEILSKTVPGWSGPWFIWSFWSSITFAWQFSSNGCGLTSLASMARCSS